MAPQILINLKIKWAGDKIISIPVTPLPDPVIVVTPPTPDPVVTDGTIIDITTLWYDTFKTGSGTLILESGKTYSISTVKRIKITGKVRIKTTGTQPAYLLVGKEMYILYIDEGQDTVLFDLNDGADVLIDNIHPSLRPQNRNVQQMYSVNWFSSVQNADVKWVALVKNCVVGEYGGFGIGLVYGGTKENYIGLINYKHSGPMLGELKNPYKDSVLHVVLDNVTTNYTDPFQWSKRAHKTTGIIYPNTNILSLTGSIETSCLYNHFFNVDTGSNRSTIAHIGRFTCMVDSIGAVIDQRHIQLRPVPKAGDKVVVKGGRFFFPKKEPHPNDIFSINNITYTIKEKLKTENDEWTNSFGSGNSPLTVKAPQCFVNEVVNIVDGEYVLDHYESSFNQFNISQEIYLIYKDDLNFRTTPTTKFGDYNILEARGGAHIMYNHRHISIWAKDVDLNSGMENGNADPYYRESTLGEGISLGYNIVNCKGFDDEFSDKLITTDKPMPSQIKDLV